MALLQVLSEEVCEFVPGDEVFRLTFANKFCISAIVEVTVGGAGNDEQLLVLRLRIGFAHDVIALGLAFQHIFIGCLTKIARVGLLTVHHEDGRANLVDVVEEAGVRKGLCTDDAPPVVGVAATLVVAALCLIIVKIVLHELRSLIR